uniref:Uncharacterized protein n=1 Tax=Arundo donax TaxID=35708 RepID=A0A0A9D4N0_ARUDO
MLSLSAGHLNASQLTDTRLHFLHNLSTLYLPIFIIYLSTFRRLGRLWLLLRSCLLKFTRGSQLTAKCYPTCTYLELQ